MFHRDVALHDQVGPMGAPIRGVEELAEDLGGEPERRVRDDTKRRPRHAERPKIRLDDASAG
jgi:hypothetical protein